MEVGVEEYRTGFRVDGSDAISLGIVRQSNANTLEVAKGVRAALERMRPLLPGGIDISVGYDESVFIGETLWNGGQTLLEAIGVIVLVIYLFPGSFRATIIPALTIAASIIPAAAVAAAFGYSINVLSVLAVVLAIGLCVDDAVVILENVRRRQQEGEPATLAAVRVTRQLDGVVLTTAPLGVAGGLVTLWALSLTVNVYSQIGAGRGRGPAAPDPDDLGRHRARRPAVGGRLRRGRCPRRDRGGAAPARGEPSGTDLRPGGLRCTA